MKLSQRLMEMYHQVSPGERVADIGTDHAYIPILLMKNNISPFVIMSDISQGSMYKAQRNCKDQGFGLPDSCFRVGDGLSTIEPGEVDTLVIGGLGGRTIAGILAADQNLTNSFSKLILQPRNNSGELRYYLHLTGWTIISERLAKEGKFICEIITASAPENTSAASSKSAETNLADLLKEGQDYRWRYPESFKYLSSGQKELLKKRLDWKFGSLNQEIQNLRKSSNNHKSLIDQLEEERDYLKWIEKD